MRIGQLRDQITLQNKTVTGRDAVGGDVFDWGNDVSVRANVRPLSAREYFSDEEQQNETVIEFTIRFFEGLDSTWRVLWNGKYFDIVEVLDVEGMGLEHRLTARTQQNV